MRLLCCFSPTLLPHIRHIEPPSSAVARSTVLCPVLGITTICLILHGVQTIFKPNLNDKLAEKTRVVDKNQVQTEESAQRG